MDLFHYIRKATPQSVKFFCARNFFGLLPDNPKRMGKIIRHNRIVLAARYLRGSGIEIGALGVPLQVPPRVTVKYVDRFNEGGLYENFPEMKGKAIVGPDIVDNAETLETISDGSQDFVIANHVIEHLQNPLLFLCNVTRVLKETGILFLAIPNKDKTFDRNRQITTFEHVLTDFNKGPSASRAAHYEDFVQHADTHNGTQAWRTENERVRLTKQLSDSDYSIHFHVWDTFAMMELFCSVKQQFHLPLAPEAMVSTGNEVVFIFQKQVSAKST